MILGRLHIHCCGSPQETKLFKMIKFYSNDGLEMAIFSDTGEDFAC